MLTITKPNEPATKRQLWHLHKITKQDTREWGITRLEASERIQSELNIVAGKDEIKITADSLLKSLKALKSSYDNELDVNGESFTRKELEYIKKNRLYVYPQNKYQYCRAYDNKSPHVDFTYEPDGKIDWEAWHIASENARAMASEKWAKYRETGAIVNGEYLNSFDIERLVKQALKTKMDSVLIEVGTNQVVVDYQTIRELCTVLKGEALTLSISDNVLTVSVDSFHSVSRMLNLGGESIGRLSI